MKRILINATQQEELRVAIVDGQKLYNLDIEVPSKAQNKANIFKGVITRVEPSLEACFVNYGSDRHGFLPMKEIVRDYYQTGADGKIPKGKVSIKDVIKEGQEVVVQVEKPERGNKGAALTTKVSLAGRYLVLMPTEPRAGGISRRIEGDDRNMVREAMDGLNVPDEMGTIVRTAGIGRSSEELQWDVDYLVTLWNAISTASEERKAPFLIYQDSSIIIRALRDHYNSDIGEIIVDDEKVFQQAQEFVQQVMPHNLRKLKFYQERVPLFNRFQIETQIESAFQREVSLPSGGAIVIDHTEALISIDVNSARATKGGDIEDTARNTNLEAADEVARQLRLRDLGGLVVIDFIDMTANKNQREVESRLKSALKHDRARVQIGRISRFGLLEMSRQRLRPSLGESSQEVCPVCSGHGTIRGVESLSLSILRLLEEEAIKDKTGRLVAHLPVEVATFLLNEKRKEIAGIEQRHDVEVIMVPNQQLVRPHFRVERIREDDQDHASHKSSSFELTEEKEPEAPKSNRPRHEASDIQQPAVQAVVPPTQMPVRAAPPAPAPITAPVVEKPGLIIRAWKSLFGTGTPVEEPVEPKKTKKPSGQRQDRNSQRKPRNNNPNEKQGSDNRKKASNKDEQRKPRNAKQGEKQTRSQRGNQAKNDQRKSGGRDRNAQQQNTDQKVDKNQTTAEAQTQNNASNQTPQKDGANKEERQGSTRRRRSRNPRGRRSDNRSNNEPQTEATSEKASTEKPQANKPDTSAEQTKQQPARRPRRSRNDPRAGLPEPNESAKSQADKGSVASDKAAVDKPAPVKSGSDKTVKDQKADKQSPTPKVEPVVVPLAKETPNKNTEKKPVPQDKPTAEATAAPAPIEAEDKAQKPAPKKEAPSDKVSKPVLVKTKAPSTAAEKPEKKPEKAPTPAAPKAKAPVAEKPATEAPKLERVQPKPAPKPEPVKQETKPAPAPSKPKPEPVVEAPKPAPAPVKVEAKSAKSEAAQATPKASDAQSTVDSTKSSEQ